MSILFFVRNSHIKTLSQRMSSSRARKSKRLNWIQSIVLVKKICTCGLRNFGSKQPTVSRSHQKFCAEFSFISFLSVIERGGEVKGRSKTWKTLRCDMFSANCRGTHGNFSADCSPMSRQDTGINYLSKSL